MPTTFISICGPAIAACASASKGRALGEHRSRAVLVWNRSAKTLWSPEMRSGAMVPPLLAFLIGVAGLGPSPSDAKPLDAQTINSAQFSPQAKPGKGVDGRQEGR